jgi:tetratricopeptide (TPR) repeat protein
MSDALSSATLRCPSCGAAAVLANGLCARCLLGVALDFDAAFADSEAIPADAPRRVGRYRILGEIARGGVGVVYRAWQPDLGREVALKMLLPARLDTPDARDRFRREAEVMAGLDHPGILPVYEVGSEGDRPFFSMKLAEGGNLVERAPHLRGRFRECARLVAAIARAVAHAHARGVLHRDLKPSNIVFDAADQPLVTDFGLARFLARESSLTGLDHVIGTPRYVAPEVVATPGERPSAAADVYGLGAILYELLTGQPPFAELTALEVLQEVRTRRPRAPRQIVAAIPAALEAICLRCLEKRREDRYPSAGALADALDGWLGGHKQPALRGLNFVLPSRRRRVLAAAALVLIGSVAAAAIEYATRSPVPIPDPLRATQSVVVLPDLLRRTPAVDEASHRIAAALELPPPLHLRPFDASLETAARMAAATRFVTDSDVDAAVGAFIVISVAPIDGSPSLLLLATDDLREERLFETTFAPGDETRVARELSAALARKRAQPTAEARLSRHALDVLLRAIRLLLIPSEGSNATAVAALKDVIEAAPDSALAHAWLAYAYIEHGGDAFWIDSAIDEAARAERMDPTLGFAAKQLGVAYQLKSWFARALPAYEQARALGTLFLENQLGWVYYVRGRFADSYRMCVERQRVGTQDPFPRRLAAQVLLEVGETGRGVRALESAIAEEPDPNLRALYEAEIAWYRDDYATCRERAAGIAPTVPELYDGFYTPTGLVRACAMADGDFAAALATMEIAKRGAPDNTASAAGLSEGLREAILLTKVGRAENVPAMLAQARQRLQTAIDANSDYPPVWLRMAAAQRAAGETDAAYATLEHAFALGLTLDRRTRGEVELVPFADDARFAAMRAASEAHVAAERAAIVAELEASPAAGRSNAGL